MLLVNIEYIPGKEIEALGMVKGTVVQSKNFGKDFMAGMKTLVGGEITGYTEMLNEARQIATKRMVDAAGALGVGVGTACAGGASPGPVMVTAQPVSAASTATAESAAAKRRLPRASLAILRFMLPRLCAMAVVALTSPAAVGDGFTKARSVFP